MSFKPYKVIFDTNSIWSVKSIDKFFGDRRELEKFSQISQIIIPDIVIEEIKTQKIRHLKSEKDSFLKNPFRFFTEIQEDKIQEFNIRQHIETVFENEEIQYTTIHLTDTKALEKIRHLAINTLPPFEERKGEKAKDKGFKDAYIYLTVLEYLKTAEEEKVFFVTEDKRLSEAFRNSGVIVINNFDDFKQYNTDYFYSDYFISNLQETLNKDITSPEYMEFWLNSQENWILKLKTEENIWLIEVDFPSKELLSITEDNFSDKIDKLIESKSFQRTHEAISDLEQYLPYFSNQQIQTLIQAAIENDQIYMICQDEDVRKFFTNLYKNRYIPLDDMVKKRFEERFINQEEEDSEEFDIPFD